MKCKDCGGECEEIMLGFVVPLRTYRCPKCQLIQSEDKKDGEAEVK